MEIKVFVGDITQMDADAIFVNLFEEVKSPGGATGAVDQALGGAISRLIEQGEIKGKLGEVTTLHTLGKIPPARVMVLGLGKQDDFSLDRVRRVMADGCRAARKLGATRIASIVHGAGAGGLAPEQSAQAMVEGSLLGLYTFRQHMTKPSEQKELAELRIVGHDASHAPALGEAIVRGRVVAEATNLCRDLVNQPANHMTPTHLAESARRVAQDHGLEVEVLEREDMEKLGMGGLLGVAQGSDQPPKFIVLRYRGDPESPRAMGFLGKGLTFDSGGISIKPAEGMGEMKGDMAGGATVIAALSAIAQLRPRVNVTALIPATENLPGGHAYRPGDVLKTLSGKTVEVISTDAEGRLILADALSYARQQELSPLVDLATLTGACRVALGDVCTGGFTNNQELMDRVKKAGEEAGEKVWQMPMYEEYKEQNKSQVADIKNTGGRYGGAITAAQFLAEFAGDTPWVHLDIAGTSFADKGQSYQVKGATGAMVRTLVNLALGQPQG